MDKRILICIVIILTISIFILLFFYYFEITPKKIFVSPSEEYFNNRFLAMERWFSEAGIPVTHWNINEFEFDLYKQESKQKTCLVIYPSYFLSGKSEKELMQWIKNGKNVILCLNESDIDNIILSHFGITVGITPHYYDYSNKVTPDYHWKLKFEVEEGKEYICYYDNHNNIRIVRIPLENGILTIMGQPSFMWNKYIGKEANACLAWKLLAEPSLQGGEDENGIITINYFAEQHINKTLLGTLMQRGNIIPVLVSVFLLILFGFWTVIPVFGMVKEEKQRNSRPIKDRFAAEISFLKKYKGLYYYDDALAAISSDKKIRSVNNERNKS